MKSMMWDLTEYPDYASLFRYLYYETDKDTGPPNILFAVYGAHADLDISLIVSDKESLEKAIETVLKYSRENHTKAHIKKIRKFLCFHDHELVPETTEIIHISEISLKAYRATWVPRMTGVNTTKWKLLDLTQLVGEDFLAALVDKE